MPKIHVSGPAYLYVSVGKDNDGEVSYDYPQSDEIFYLGSCEDGVDIIIRPQWLPIASDISGGDKGVPHDYAFLGEDAVITGKLTLYNEYVYSKISSRANYYDGTRGTDGERYGIEATEVTPTRGQLMIANGRSYHLWVQCPYASKVPNSEGLMPDCYHFFAAWSSGMDTLSLGARVGKRQFFFTAHPVYRFERVGGTQVFRSFSLYDHDATSIPDYPPNNDTGQLDPEE